MKTATVRDLRNNFSKLEAWLAEGETILIQKRGRPVAVLSPKRMNGVVKSPLKHPNYRERLRKIWGNKCFTLEEIREMREYELEGEQG